MHALIAAGGVPGPEDPMYPFTQGGPRALVDVAGKPMVQWVLDALGGSRSCEQIVIVGLRDDVGLSASRPLHYVPDQGGLLQNILAGLHRIQQLDPAATYALYVSADIPAVTPEIVDWRIHAAEGFEKDVDYVAIERSVMEARFPESRRSYVRLRDMDVCGSDMNVLRLGLAGKEELWERFIAARKSLLRQAALIGFDTLFLLLTKRLTLKEGERRVSRRFNISGRIHLSPYPELGMDVDKPFQLEIVRRDLSAAPSN